MNFEQQMQINEARRAAAEVRYMARMDKAFDMVGELANGRFYIYPVGGKYREAADRVELVSFLMRNRYV